MPKPRQERRQAPQSNTYRFFVGHEALHDRAFQIEDAELAHQLAHVLRLRPGDRVMLLDNSGWQHEVELAELGRAHVAGRVIRKELASGEPRIKLTLYATLLRAERFELVLQKGTELGVSAFVPLICERSTIADAHDLSERKIDRWGRIIREAAEQSRRGKLPRLVPAQLFATACEQVTRHGHALLLWEGGGVAPLRQVLRERLPGGAGESTATSAGAGPFSIAVFSGPEGGLTAAEFECARSYGIIPVTLGPRTLRAETAPLVAAAAILYEFGDLD